MKRVLLSFVLFFELLVGLVIRTAWSAELTSAPGASPVETFVTGYTRHSLSHRWKKLTRSITQAVLSSAERFHLDPLLILAVIEQESHFLPMTQGSHGEIGLMQLKPGTAQWIARISGFHWHGKRTLFDPATNIRLGSAYLAHLRDLEPEPAGMLAAYNLGFSRHQRFLRENLPEPVYA
ncbi:MAG: lytic transglycosylase domain-containing protein, partial [Bdellovibrionota bacterium]